MRSVFLMFAALLSMSFVQTAHAAPSAICGRFMNCGTFEGSGNWYAADGVAAKETYAEKVIISAVNKTTMNIKVYIYQPGTDPSKGWTLDSNLVFQDDGQYSLVDSDGVSHAGGFCANKVCTIAFQPVVLGDEGGSDKGKTNSFVDILRFEGKTLKRYNMVSNSMSDSDLHFQRSELTLK